MATEPIAEEVLAGAEVINMLGQEYDIRTQERHIEGGEKYGPLKFIDADTLEEAINEVLDLGNYARYTFIKLRILQHALARILEESGMQPELPFDQAVVGFIPAGKFTKPGEVKE